MTIAFTTRQRLRTRHEAHDGVGRVVSVLPALLVHVAVDGDGQGERVRAREGVREMRRYSRMTHVDLFSGIGGFALAAHANGIRTVQFCEIDSRCRDFLSKTWPGVAIHDDIRTFHFGVADAKRRAPFLLTAGVPCQPASRAGKQRGEADDRWLWPEAIRVLRETSPAWCLFENPPGIGDLEFDRILADVEAEGYEVEVLSIPACAVNAPHRRERYWIVGKRMAHADEPRREGPDVREGRRDAHGLCAERAQGDLADIWQRFVWLPCADGKVRRAPDDTFGLVDGLHRSILGALGNSIVPQVAARVIAAMVKCSHIGDANEMVRGSIE
jgi:hypothetical protein